jgi:hypothetical protein
MSSYAGVYLQGVEIYSWRNEIDPTFLFLFTSQDVRRVPRGPEEIFDDEENELIKLTAAAAVLSDRLDVLGIGPGLEAMFDEIAKNEAEILRSIRSLPPPQVIGSESPQSVDDELSRLVDDEIDLLESITLAGWVDRVTEALKSPEKRGRPAFHDPTTLQWLLNLWEDVDPRYMLRALLLGCDTDVEVTIDVTDLIAGGWIDEGFDPQSAAIEHFSYALANGSPAVVVTEGTTDAQILQAAIQIRYPHLLSFIRFFDFANGAEGSAAAGVRTLKSFAAAGISNRVVLILDNDSAARDAMRALRGVQLPKHYSVLTYPEIELARHYPTLGPSGLSHMDVNGLAGSIEMYLGRDVLASEGGTLTPVQWRSYLQGLRAYQGEVLDKAGVQTRFRDKVKLATEDADQVRAQDWSGLDAIIEHLMATLRDTEGS